MKIINSLEKLKVEQFGQVFTPPSIVDFMLGLRQNHGRVLEPACGDGAFSQHLTNCVAIELDTYHASPSSLVMDFFAYPVAEKFPTIIGNPPYVRYQDILRSTKDLLLSDNFDLRTNLYLFFIEKCINHLDSHGELIFITPRDFIKSTSSIKLNKWLYAQGTITHAIELGDSRVFKNAVPNCLIWRYEKDQFNRTMKYSQIGNKDNYSDALQNPHWQQRYFVEAGGHFMFSQHGGGIQLSRIAEVKVGAVTGADSIYANETHGNRDFVYSATAKTGKTRKMFWANNPQEVSEYLLSNKSKLLQRKIRNFDENNWWQWGRGYPINDSPRVYVNCKTRNNQAFFTHPCNNFDGAVLAIFPKQDNIDLQQFCHDLNSVNWQQLGFVCDGRFIFAQRSLENAQLPDFFAKYI